MSPICSYFRQIVKCQKIAFLVHNACYISSFCDCSLQLEIKYVTLWIESFDMQFIHSLQLYLSKFQSGGIRDWYVTIVVHSISIHIGYTNHCYLNKTCQRLWLIRLSTKYVPLSGVCSMKQWLKVDELDGSVLYGYVGLVWKRKLIRGLSDKFTY